ncbi:Dephospho-CoA kinase [Coemansia interrupta]|uniref:Dephospho-CoA kinase n=1 Tax=Coemansia interrupta TaxID=1126814 RepID=A0A9W8HK14_9FUNG|nr:Dephospho-CoA kinase [Coemansia interrupta]
MLIVGLTGGIATGKSTASRALQASGVPVIDADVVAHQVMQPGEASYKLVVKHFGTSILQSPNGPIDRAKLGAVIFNDSEKRELLNRCTHPFVRRRILWQLFCTYARGHAVCVLDVPLLYEAGMHRLCGRVVVVGCAREVQVERLMERNGLGREEAVARVDAQMPVEQKAKRADAVVMNEGSVEDMQEEVCRVVRAWSPAPWRVAGALLAPVIGLGALCAWAVAKVLGRM